MQWAPAVVALSCITLLPKYVPVLKGQDLGDPLPMSPTSVCGRGHSQAQMALLPCVPRFSESRWALWERCLPLWSRGGLHKLESRNGTTEALHLVFLPSFVFPSSPYTFK